MRADCGELPVVQADDPGVLEPVRPLSLEDLSLYTSPEPRDNSTRGEALAAGQIERTVASLRSSVEPFTSWCQSSYARIKPKIQNGVRAGTEAYSFLLNPPSHFYPRVAVVGFSGILGLLASRGARVKRVLYPAGLMTFTTALYYPESAALVVKTGVERAYGGAVQSYAAVEKILKQEPKKESGNKP
uniref:MICOS complex subunit n=1 Tax=Knipowitschia caucasica TaxID=637954 RepID=A0AAV2JNE9_KNICA